MPHNVFVRDVGGGIYPRPVPENFLDFGAFPYALSQSDFQRCIVASLNTTSTAARAANVVTITSTAHGVPSTFNGFRFYYPGSPTLAAGWVDNITVTGANTITFPSIGADFGSESINGAAAYVAATNIPGGILIPAGMITDTTVGRLAVNCAALNTAATKTIRPLISGGSFIAPGQTATTYPCLSREWDLSMLNSTQLVGNSVNVGSSSLPSIVSFSSLVDNLITLQLTVSAAQDYFSIISQPKLIIYK